MRQKFAMVLVSPFGRVETWRKLSTRYAELQPRIQSTHDGCRGKYFAALAAMVFSEVLVSSADVGDSQPES